MVNSLSVCLDLISFQIINKTSHLLYRLMRSCSYLPQEDVTNVCIYSFIYYSCTLQHMTLTSAYCDNVKLKARFAFTMTKLFFFGLKSHL